jgi:plasmid stability protein
VVITLELSDELYAYLKWKARRTHRSIPDVIRAIIARDMARSRSASPTG